MRQLAPVLLVALVALVALAASAATSAAQDAPRVAPARYEDVILRLDQRGGSSFANLRYEGNNVSMRGPRRGGVATRPFAADGEATARHWRESVARTRGVFVLRDSLFSQQDHPFEQRPFAVLMPPSWVSVATAAAASGTPATPMQIARADDDAGWAALDDAHLFGSFPPATRVSELARRALHATGASDDDRSRIAAARATLAMLAADVDAMSGSDPQAVARAGAARLAASDRAYFGDARGKAIPIYVELPSEHEQRDEGKGFVPWGATIPDAPLALARHAVLAARLADGDLALERYDLTKDAERAHAVALLVDLVPRGHAPRGGTVFVWVHAGLVGDSPRAPDAVPHVPRFRQELAAASIELSRVVIVVRPSVELPSGAARARGLEAAVDRFRAATLPLSVHCASRAFADMIAARR